MNESTVNGCLGSAKGAIATVWTIAKPGDLSQPTSMTISNLSWGIIRNLRHELITEGMVAFRRMGRNTRLSMGIRNAIGNLCIAFSTAMSISDNSGWIDRFDCGSTRRE